MMKEYLHQDKYFSYVVDIKTIGTLEMANWCEENCSDTFSGTDKSTLWLFNSEEDAIAFKLRWL